VARYTPDSKERVRDAVDMIDLVGTRTELKRAGTSRYAGLCPFHEERSPSFGIDPNTKLYHCFGCGVGGDCFTFVQELEGLDFTGALEFLAERYNVTLEADDDDPQAAEKRRRHDRLLELLERTAAYYVRMLWESDEAGPSREYLAGRGLHEPILREFRVGYAPSAWDRVLTASRRSGFSEGELAAAGLVSRSRENGRVYDRFRRRIMFPLCDRRGAVLGFGARAVGPDQQPKYLNSADGELYHKGRHVFGFHNARAAAAKAGTVILAEGYTDVIALHQAGLSNTVGLMGTALTPDQVSELARMAKVVQLALDADGAGQEAMLRAARVARGKDLDLRIVPLPAGSDPADLVLAEGADHMRELAQESVPFVSFQVDRALAAGDVASAEGKDRVIEALRPVFAPATLPPGALREELLKRVADRLNLAQSLVSSWLSAPSFAAAAGGDRPANPNGNGNGGAGAGGTAPRAALSRDERQQRAFLALCIATPADGVRALTELDIERDFTTDLLRAAARHLRAHAAAPLDELPGELAALIPELAVRAADLQATPAMLELERLQLELARVEREIVVARGAGSGVGELAQERLSLQGAVDRAMLVAMDDTAPTDVL
jgi:DNA primase